MQIEKVFVTIILHKQILLYTTQYKMLPKRYDGSEKSTQNDVLASRFQKIFGEINLKSMHP